MLLIGPQTNILIPAKILQMLFYMNSVCYLILFIYLFFKTWEALAPQSLSLRGRCKTETRICHVYVRLRYNQDRGSRRDK